MAVTRQRKKTHSAPKRSRNKPASPYATSFGNRMRQERARLGYPHPSTFGPLVGERPTNYPAYEKGLMDMSLTKFARFVWALGLENEPVKLLLGLRDSDAPIHRVAPAQDSVSDSDIRHMRDMIERNPASPLVPMLRRTLHAAEATRRRVASS